MTNKLQKIIDWRKDPNLFVRECFNVIPDKWQEDVLGNFPNSQRTALIASKGPGKSAVLSWLAWNFLFTRPETKIAATSITAENLNDGLWTEMAKWRNKSKIIGEHFEWSKTRIFNKKKSETWWMSARTWPKTADATRQADTLAGLHADYLLFIMDEAGGIPDAVGATAEAGLATGIETKLLIAGNPTHLEGPLYRAATSESNLWFTKHVTSDPDDPDRTPRVSKQWAREQIEKYGADSDWVLVNVFGKFPKSSINTLLGPDEVRGCIGRHLNPNDFSFAQKRIGIDVARFGADRTVLFPRQGRVANPPIVMRNARTNEIAARAAKEKAIFGSELEFVDDTGGWGGGVVDSMIQAGLNPIPVNFSGRADDSRYLNKRAEMWFKMADWIKSGGALPNMPELIRELTAPTYTFQNGKFKLEEKAQIKTRLGFSPDLADALALTFAIEEQAARSNNPLDPQGATGKLIHDYDPFADS